MIKIKFIFNKDVIGLKLGYFGLYYHPQFNNIRFYNHNAVKTYYINPIAEYRKIIERELTEKHLNTLLKKYPEIFKKDNYVFSDHVSKGGKL